MTNDERLAMMQIDADRLIHEIHQWEVSTDETAPVIQKQTIRNVKVYADALKFNADGLA